MNKGELSDAALAQIGVLISKTFTAELSPIRKDISELKEDVKTIKLVQGQQSITLMEMRTDIRSLKTTVRQHSKGLHKLGVLFEDLDDQFFGSRSAA